jgi:hypothetical protein
MTIVSASTDQGEAGYLTFDWEAMAAAIGAPHCVGVGEVEIMIAALRETGLSDCEEVADTMAAELAVAAVAAEWNEEWTTLAFRARRLS